MFIPPASFNAKPGQVEVGVLVPVKSGELNISICTTAYRTGNNTYRLKILLPVVLFHNLPVTKWLKAKISFMRKSQTKV
jgi:hypothetical protein